MQAKASDGSESERNLKDQGVVLMHLLDRYPEALSIEWLAHELTGGWDRYSKEWQRYKDATWTLRSKDLLYLGYETFSPTKAARCFNELIDAGAIS